MSGTYPEEDVTSENEPNLPDGGFIDRGHTIAWLARPGKPEIVDCVIGTDPNDATRRAASEAPNLEVVQLENLRQYFNKVYAKVNRDTRTRSF